jgi:hypothetical protein
MTNATSKQPRILTDNDLAQGKTVLRCDYFGEFAAIVFTDETALIFEVDGDEDCSGCVELRTKHLPPYESMMLGFMTREEYSIATEQELAERAAEREAADRRKYEELRRRFDVDGGQGKPSTAVEPSKP